jgi:hypothetical protein
MYILCGDRVWEQLYIMSRGLYLVTDVHIVWGLFGKRCNYVGIVFGNRCTYCVGIVFGNRCTYCVGIVFGNICT